MIRPTLFSLVALFAVTAAVNTSTSLAEEQTNPWLNYYTIEDIAIPKGVDPQISGLEALKNGTIAASFHDGNLLILDPKTLDWSKYATGLHEPLGIKEDKTGALVVAQMAELTRLVDEDSDGQADLYQTLSEDFGITGNYHEFAFGPAMDSKGNMFISLNVASNHAGIFQEIRGPYNQLCPPQEEMKKWHDKEAFKKTGQSAGRMFSCAPYRGWILKITPEGETIPYASGLRSPNGIHIDKQDRLWVTDNQGDWIGTSPLHLVEEGDFLGHPASLLWKKGWSKKAIEIVPSDLEAMRKPAVALFPQGELANSPTQPINTIDPEKFGLPEGELIIGDMNQNNLIRFIPDEVKGTMQGTVLPFINGDELGIGNNRFTFTDDGSLWVGKMYYRWAGDIGIKKISWNKKPFLYIKKVSQVKNGLAIEFSQPMPELLPEILVSRHTYHYHSQYGSEKVDLTTVPVVTKSLDKTNTILTVTFNELTENRLYTVEINHAKDRKNRPLMGDLFWYNLVKRKY
ncbi:hypothetical protein [Paraglaciecola sp. L3A3]|uniref:hypothetical protein n=1 Tax=Paraglaciecola sp. L3A3 TaxID=2686358 RepID=UPI0018EF2ED9|nr:hypothetical protein [Paraglaciecola sp. L3A3]